MSDIIFDPKNIAIIGSSGAIGGALVSVVTKNFPNAQVHEFSRSGANGIDYDNEESIAHAAEMAAKEMALDLVIVTNGILHDDNISPEKSLRDLSADNFSRIFTVNTITPALVAKYFIPKLNKEGASRFAALSARVGSISDNVLGGWYAYRASKAALNMIIKNAAIETARRNKQAVIVGLHPGTVDSNLSKPFQRNVPADKLFKPEFSAQKMLDALSQLTPEDSGKCFAWDGQQVQP